MMKMNVLVWSGGAVARLSPVVVTCPVLPTARPKLIAVARAGAGGVVQETCFHEAVAGKVTPELQ